MAELNMPMGALLKAFHTIALVEAVPSGQPLSHELRLDVVYTRAMLAGYMGMMPGVSIEATAAQVLEAREAIAYRYGRG